MEPSFSDKVWLIIIDKALLALAGGGIALLSAVFIERYKRHQSVVLELGKLRAQAFARIVSLLGEQRAIIDEMLTTKNDARFKVLQERLTASAGEQMSSFLKDASLLDETLRVKFRAYAKAVTPDVKMDSRPNMSEADAEARRVKLNTLREEILAYLPPLPKP